MVTGESVRSIRGIAAVGPVDGVLNDVDVGPVVVDGPVLDDAIVWL